MPSTSQIIIFDYDNFTLIFFISASLEARLDNFWSDYFLYVSQLSKTRHVKSESENQYLHWKWLKTFIALPQLPRLHNCKIETKSSC